MVSSLFRLAIDGKQQLMYLLKIAFIDPFFSSGVHLALTSALSAASTICAALGGDCSERDAAEWHTKRVATSYTR